MFLQLFSLVLCVSYACSTCLDSGDIDIKGLCFKFVAQQMTFNDARNWCHYQNPVISSYLAYVPDQYTSNFLASYARTAFRSANGIFWIGLSRNNISSWVWDNGNPVTYTNFGTQLGQNYVAESSANSKWSTFGENDKNFFVCSYDPAAPPTFRPPIVTTTQVPITEDTSCKPIGSLTYLFAFSNDLDPQVVKDSWNNFHVGGIAIARFDVRDEEDIVYFTDFKNATAYLLDHLPNSKLGFGDTMTGSSSLRTIEPNESDISKTVTIVRQHHGMVNAITSIYPSGGTRSKALYNLTSKTNGMNNCGKDEDFEEITKYLPDFSATYPSYCANPLVSGQGSMNLPSMMGTYSGVYITTIAVQDHGPVDSFNSLDLSSFSKDNGSSDLAMNSTDFFESRSIIDGGAIEYYLGVNTMKLQYNYSTSIPQIIQIRIHCAGIPNDWLPYCE